MLQFKYCTIHIQFTITLYRRACVLCIAFGLTVQGNHAGLNTLLRIRHSDVFCAPLKLLIMQIHNSEVTAPILIRGDANPAVSKGLHLRPKRGHGECNYIGLKKRLYISKLFLVFLILYGEIKGVHNVHVPTV